MLVCRCGRGWAEPLTVGLSDADNSATVTVGRTVYLWGAQAEQNSTFLSSYIPTVPTLSAARAADVAVMTGSNFSDWYNEPAGTFAVEFDVLTASSPIRTIFEADNGTTAEYHSFWISTNQLLYYVKDNNVQQASLILGTVSSGNTAYKMAGSYIANDVSGCAGGGAVSTDTSATMPTVTQLRIGGDGVAADYLNGHVRRIQFQNVKVDNPTLQTLPQPPTGTTTPVEPQPPAVGPTTTGGSAFWDQDYDGREYESSRKRRKRFLQERERRFARTLTTGRRR